MSLPQKQPVSTGEISGIRQLSGFWLWVPRVATLALTLLAIDYLFNLGSVHRGDVGGKPVLSMPW
ncbi:MAG: hypothetical protein MH208_18960 [Marinobacter sp.]|nr:hypothetical protein [Marinobacter sp.]